MGVGFAYKIGLDESIFNVETAVGIPRDAGVDNVREFAEWDLRDIVGRIEEFSAGGVVGDDALGNAFVFVFVVVLSARWKRSQQTCKDRNEDGPNECGLFAQCHEALPGKISPVGLNAVGRGQSAGQPVYYASESARAASGSQGDRGRRNSSRSEYLSSPDANHHSLRSSMLACFVAQA
jgi:hypothetical protein